MRVAIWPIAALLVLSPVSFAQSASGPIPLQTSSGTGFTGAPYSGRETTVTEKTLSDHTTTTQTFVQLLWRDASGRTRREMIRHTETGEEYRSVIITDPVAGVYLKWQAGDMSALKVASIWPLASAQKVTATAGSEPASLMNPGSGVSRPGYLREVLTPQTINGEYAQGTRTTRTIRLDEEDSNRVIEVSNELWISPELRIIMRHVTIDPRTGKSTTEMSDVVRGDPDPGLFQAPDGYQVVDHREKNSQ